MSISSSSPAAELPDALCNACHQPPRGCALRRGMCRACYLRAWRGTALPESARCLACDEQRRVVLRWTQVGDERVVTCQNCGFLVDKARPRVTGSDDLLRRMARERRRLDRRRNYVVDPEDPSERRERTRRATRKAKRAS